MFHLSRKVFRPKELVNPLSQSRNTGIILSPEVHITIMAAILSLASLFAKKNMSSRLWAPAIGFLYLPGSMGTLIDRLRPEYARPTRHSEVGGVLDANVPTEWNVSPTAEAALPAGARK
jgi:hypothetical protein